MVAPRLGAQLAAAGLVVGAVLLADSSGWLSAHASVVLDNSAQFAGGLFATVCCGWSARRTVGVERAWRRLVGVGALAWTGGQVIWSWYQITGRTALPSPSLADVGYLTMPVFALLALLAVTADSVAEQRRTPSATGSTSRSRVVLVFDGLIVVGSLLVLTWATALGAVVRGEAPTTLAFVVAIAYPVTDLVLVVIVVLLLAARPVPRRLRPQLSLLGLGLVGLSASDSIFAYVVASGGETMPPITNAGFIAGPVLVGLAALTRGNAKPVSHRRAAWYGDGWVHVLLPYAPLAATLLLIVQGQATGRTQDSFEVYLETVVVGLVVARQMITLIDNQALLGRVRDAQGRLHYQAYHDPLTGLANRALFHTRLAAAVDPQHDTRRRVALYFIDLDDFKLINDSFGHAAGDRVLQLVGERLLANVRGIDTVARLGGDEFGVLLEGERDDVQKVGHRILAALRQPFELDEHAVTIGASIGAAIAGPTATLTADALLRRADAAMYAGKREGKGQFLLYQPGDDAAGHEHPDLPTLLARALRDETPASGLSVVYQSIVALDDGRLAAVEALARWHDPVIGSISPSVFVSVAERAGLVSALDDYVLDRSCRDLAEYQASHQRPISVHVNVSGRRLGTPELETSVKAALRRHSLHPAQVVLEITEGSRIPDPEAAAASVTRLRAMGVRIALDDLGAGYNSLSQLHLLPLDIVKLDRSLTGPDVLSTDAWRAQALCRSIVAIATNLGITVVAEGVETPDQAEALRRAGCTYAQGYLYATPTSLAAINDSMAGSDTAPAAV